MAPETERREQVVTIRGAAIAVRALSLRGLKRMGELQETMLHPTSTAQVADTMAELAALLSGLPVEAMLDMTPGEIGDILAAGRDVNDMSDLKKKLIPQGPTTQPQ